MAEYGTTVFTGTSGAKYEFSVFSRDTRFKKIGAVYFMTRRVRRSDGGFRHTHVYVGETGDLSRRPLNRERKLCFDKRAANCLCIYPERNEATRRKIVKGLENKYLPLCNDGSAKK